MRIRYLPLGLLGLTLTGCLEQATPTSPLLEQAVFNAFGGLQVGETMRFTGAAAAEILVGIPAVTGEFVYIPFHASRSQGADLRIEVEGTNVQSGSGASSSLQRSGVVLDPAKYPSDRLHEELFLRQRREFEAARRRIRPSLSRVPAAGARPRTDLSGGSAQVGELVQINTDTDGDFCEGLDYRTARVEAISEHAILLGDVANPVGGFTRANYEEIGDLFDSLVYPTVITNFAEPTDIDDNDRVIIFFTYAVNQMTDPDEDGFIGGFFYARDLLPKAECPASNAGEIFYVIAPDPNAIPPAIPHSLEDVRRQGIATVGHELEHLINASRRVYVNNAQALEDSWLDEGLAHIAEELIFYAAADLDPESNLSLEDFTSNQARVDAINRYGLQNLARYGQYLEDVTRHSPTNTEDNLETRGGAWSFLRYAADHSELSDAEFFGQLVNATLTGFNNIGAVLEGGPLTWLQDWGVSIYTDDLVTAGDALLQQPSWDFRSLLPVLFDDFPLDVETLDPGETEELILRATTSGFVEVAGTPGGSMRVRTTSGGARPSEELRVTVVRIE